MKTNAEISHSVLTVRQANSLLNLQAKAERSGGYVRISPAQLNAMQIAWNAVRASGNPIPAEAYRQAAEIGLK